MMKFVQSDKMLLTLLALVFVFLAWHGYHYNESGLSEFAQKNITLLIGALLFSMRSGSPQDREPTPPSVVNLHFPKGMTYTKESTETAVTPIQLAPEP